MLEEIRLISGIETHKEKVLRIMLAGQPELRDLVESPSLKQLVQRVRLRFHLGPLDRRETREYIEHRLSVAGRSDNELFADDCFDLIHRFTGGVPRLVNTLCDTALLCAFADDKSSIDGSDIGAAIEELNWREPANDAGNYEGLRRVERRVPDDGQVTQITVHANGEVVAEYSFPIGRVIVGRSQENEIYIKSKFVSRHHAQLVSDDRGCVIEDLNSTNGVFVGEKQVKKYRLRDGDRVSLGVHELVYHDLRLDEQQADNPLENQLQDDDMLDKDVVEEDMLDEDMLDDEPDSAVNEQ